MPKRPKSGPPYTDIPKEIYVVVTNPWGMNATPRSRVQGDFNRVASWAQLVLQQAGLGGGRIATIECIYSMGTRDEIILQFQEGTDIIPLLGEHRWANFAKGWNPNDTRSTRVFIYNWRNNGDPGNHNWSENFPKPLPLDSVPVKSPYPAPSWTQPPTTLTNFVLPIPHPPILPPVPNREHNPGQEQQLATLPRPSVVTPSPAPPEQDQPESGEQAVAQDSVPTNLFKPYEPPSQHASLARFLNREQARCDEAPSSRASPPPPKFIKKLDPYELDEDALNALRSPDPSEEDTKDAKHEDIEPTLPLSVKLELPEVKTEDGDVRYNITSGSGSRYQPSQALVEAFSSLAQPEQKPPSARLSARDPRSRLSTVPRTAIPARSGYQPSEELEAEINNFLMGATSSSSSSSASGTRPRVSSVAGIKREYEEDASTSLGMKVGETKRIKIEEC